jgi:hypothetical protein
VGNKRRFWRVGELGKSESIRLVGVQGRNWSLSSNINNARFEFQFDGEKLSGGESGIHPGSVHLWGWGIYLSRLAKTLNFSVILSLLGGASSGSAKPVAPSIQVASTPDRTENAGNVLNVAFTASGIPARESAEVWLVDAATHTAITQLVAIDLPVRNGANVASFHIPVEFTQSEKLNIQ